MEPHEEIAALRRDVAALKNTVATLVELLQRSNAFGMDRTQVERALAAAARRAREEAEAAEQVDEPAAVAGSAYRGPIPAASNSACAACGKPRAQYDPELVLRNRGRVCVSCFHRGADR